MAEKQAAPAAAPAAVAPRWQASGRPVQATSITPNAAPGTSFVLTGFVKADALFTDTSNADVGSRNGRDFYVPGATPVTGQAEGADFNAHIKQSRVNFGTDTVLDGGDKLSTRFEIDFFGRPGHERVATLTPPSSARLRAVAQLARGADVSNFMDLATLQRPRLHRNHGRHDLVRQPQVRPRAEASVGWRIRDHDHAQRRGTRSLRRQQAADFRAAQGRLVTSRSPACCGNSVRIKLAPPFPHADPCDRRRNNGPA
jgi:hypothetical protein